jgi:hypothetical protein
MSNAARRWVGYTVIYLFVSLAGSFVYLTEPYISVAEVRTTGQLETIRSVFGLACEASYMFGYKGDQSLGKLTLVIPEGGIGPEDTEALVSDNSFELIGYRYKSIRRNFITGEYWETASDRFDVVEWHAIAPYKVQPLDENGNYKETSAPLGWRGSNPNALFTSEHQPERQGC